MKKITNKKAIGQDIDWVIASGIFIIYLILTLVYFKPGIKPVNNPETMLGIVEENFKNSAYWTLTTQPMFVEAITCQVTTPPPNDCTLKLNSEIVEFMPELYNFTQVDVSPKNPTKVGGNNNNLTGLDSEKTKIFFVSTVSNPASEAPDAASSSGAQTRSSARSNSGTLGSPTPLDRALTNLNGAISSCSSSWNVASSPPLQKADAETFCQTVISTEIKDRAEGHDDEDDDSVNNQCTDRKKYNLCKKFMDEVTEQNARSNSDAPISNENPVPSSEVLPQEGDLRDYYLKFNTSDGFGENLKFKPVFSAAPKKYKYLLITSDRAINKEEVLQTGNPAGATNNLPKACMFTNFKESYTVNQGTLCKAMYELGVAETLKGVRVLDIVDYAGAKCPSGKEGYACMKELWSYPANKEFKITIYDKDQVRIAEFPVEPIVPTNVNVYSRSFSTFILSEDGIRKPVTVSILVW